MTSSTTATLKRLIVPLPQPERGRPFIFDVTPKSNSLVCFHNNSAYILTKPTPIEIRNPYPISIVKVSPDEGQIALGDINGNLRIMTLSSGPDSRTILEQRVLSGRISSIVWSQDGNSLFLCGDGRGSYVTAINTKTGQSLGEFAGPTKCCNSIAINSKGIVAVASDDFTVTLFSGPKFSNVKTLRYHNRFVSSVEFIGDNLISVGADGKLFIINTEGKDENVIDFTSVCNLAMNCSFTGLSVCEGIIFTSSTDGIIRKWDIEKKTCDQSDPLNQQVLGIKSTIDGVWIILLDGTFVKLSPNITTQIDIVMGHSKSISCLEFEREELLISTDLNGRLINWLPKQIMSSTNNEEIGINFLLRNGHIGINSLNKKVFNIPNSSITFSIPDSEDKILFAADHSADDIKIFTKSFILIYNVKDGSLKSTHEISESNMTAATIYDEDKVYYFDDKKNIRQMKLEGDTIKEESILMPNSNKGKITCLAISPDGQFLAAGDDQRRIQLYNLHSNEMISTKWCFHDSTITSLDWSPDGKYLVSGGLDGALIIWSPQSKSAPILQIPSKGTFVNLWLKIFVEAHNGPVQVVKYKGSSIWSAGDDCTIRQWSFN